MELGHAGRESDSTARNHFIRSTKPACQSGIDARRGHLITRKPEIGALPAQKLEISVSRLLRGKSPADPDLF